MEEVPTLLCNGEHITEVLFTGWEETAPGAWTLVRGTDKLEIKSDMNRIVYELPIGCYEQPMNLSAGDTITFRVSSGFGEVPERCRVPHGFEQAETVPFSIPKTAPPILKILAKLGTRNER